MKYVPKQVPVEAWQVEEGWFDVDNPNPLRITRAFINPKYKTVELMHSKCSFSVACAGDWIVEYPDGQRSVMSDYDFKATYEATSEVTSEAVGEKT